MQSTSGILQTGLNKLKGAPTDEAEDALESLNRKSVGDKKINKAYHEQMPKEKLKVDIKKGKKADIAEDKKALKAKEFRGGGIEEKNFKFSYNKRNQN
jgi:hypothetical protein